MCSKANLDVIESTEALCLSCGCREQFDLGVCEACYPEVQADLAKIAAEETDETTVDLVEFRYATVIITGVVEETKDLWASVRVVAISEPCGWKIGEVYTVPMNRFRPVEMPF